MSIFSMVEELHHVIFLEEDKRYDILSLNIKFVIELVILFLLSNYIDQATKKPSRDQNISVAAT